MHKTAICARKVERVLRDLGFWPAGSQIGGHPLWTNGRVSCRPSTYRRSLTNGAVHSLGLSLEAHGICTRRDFKQAVKAA